MHPLSVLQTILISNFHYISTKYYNHYPNFHIVHSYCESYFIFSTLLPLIFSMFIPYSPKKEYVPFNAQRPDDRFGQMTFVGVWEALKSSPYGTKPSALARVLVTQETVQGSLPTCRDRNGHPSIPEHISKSKLIHTSAIFSTTYLKIFIVHHKDTLTRP